MAQLWVLVPRAVPAVSTTCPVVPALECPHPLEVISSLPQCVKLGLEEQGEQDPKPLQWLDALNPQEWVGGTISALLPNTTPIQGQNFSLWDVCSKDTVREILTRARAGLARGRLF